MFSKLQLEMDITRLECLLELPLKPYPKLTRTMLHKLQESKVDPSPTHTRHLSNAVKSRYM